MALSSSPAESPALVLGSAQWGMRYGRSNTVGKTPLSEVVEILMRASQAGIHTIDTARAYGDAERTIAEAVRTIAPTSRFTIVTKLDPLEGATPHTTDKLLRSLVNESVARSMETLELAHLDTVLLHRWEHRHLGGGIIWETLKDLKRTGAIVRLGASVQSASEAHDALLDPEIEHIQLPFNIFDDRWFSAGLFPLLHSRSDVTIHARSIFLQGLIHLEGNEWPAIPDCNAGALLAELDQLVIRLGRHSRRDLAVAYARAQSWIHGAVIGMESSGQCEDTLTLFKNPPLTSPQVDEVRAILGTTNEALLNPALWGPA